MKVGNSGGTVKSRWWRESDIEGRVLEWGDGGWVGEPKLGR